MVLEEFPSLAGIILSFTKHCKLNYDALHTFRPLPVPGSAQGPCYDDLIQLFLQFWSCSTYMFGSEFSCLDESEQLLRLSLDQI